jgi:hypothetical protein
VSENDKVKKFIQTAFNDPIANILRKHSNLTDIQYETIIIDILSSNISDKELTYEDKTLFRTNIISRGSFCRTLSQARRNVVSSIYTVLLLSYLGILQESPFDEYQTLLEKLREYSKLADDPTLGTSRHVLSRIESELFDEIKRLSEPKGLSVT